MTGLKLILHLSDGIGLNIFQPWAFFGYSQKPRMDAIWKAKEVLSAITFDQRLGKYEQQLKAKKFFSYGRYQFREGGEVFKDGKLLFNVKDQGIIVVLNPFSIRFIRRQKSLLQKVCEAFWSWDDIIDISKDRDCFLYMYRMSSGQFWSSEHYRERGRGSSRTSQR